MAIQTGGKGMHQAKALRKAGICAAVCFWHTVLTGTDTRACGNGSGVPADTDTVFLCSVTV